MGKLAKLEQKYCIRVKCPEFENCTVVTKENIYVTYVLSRCNNEVFKDEEALMSATDSQMVQKQ